MGTDYAVCTSCLPARLRILQGIDVYRPRCISFRYVFISQRRILQGNIRIQKATIFLPGQFFEPVGGSANRQVVYGRRQNRWSDRLLEINVVRDWSVRRRVLQDKDTSRNIPFGSWWKQNFSLSFWKYPNRNWPILRDKQKRSAFGKRKPSFRNPHDQEFFRGLDVPPGIRQQVPLVGGVNVGNCSGIGQFLFGKVPGRDLRFLYYRFVWSGDFGCRTKRQSNLGLLSRIFHHRILRWQYLYLDQQRP